MATGVCPHGGLQRQVAHIPARPSAITQARKLRQPSRPRSQALCLLEQTPSSNNHPPHPLDDTMRWFTLLTASLLPFVALAAKKPAGDRFNDARAKSLSTGRPLKLNDASYAQLTKSPRDYGVAVLLTALEPRFGCALCRSFQPEWDLLGNSWTKGDKDGQSRLVFGTLDFVDGKNVFQSVWNSHTHILYFYRS